MKTRSLKKEIGIVSLGCAKNLVDSERLARQLESEGITLLTDPAPGHRLDVVIINTCGFIGDAKQESVDTILGFVNEKRAGRVDRLFVMGCLTERYKEQIAKEIPEVDGCFGVNELPSVVRAAEGTYRRELLGERRLITPSHYAYLKIAEGCDRKCSFCAIPGIRGPHRSRPESSLIREAEMLAEKGVKELLVISQDTTWYGLDRYGERRLAGLLKKLARIRGIEWIRLHYTYPHGFPADVLDVMREEEKICRYVDIPLQHISDRILRSMKRGFGGDRTRALVEKIRNKVPGVAIRTTFITGYPGETNAEFDELQRFIRDMRFERAGVFTYSEEEGTRAALLKDNVPAKLKAERAARLMELQESISLEINSQRIGQELTLLIDRKEGDAWIGRTEFDSPEVDNEVIVTRTYQKLAPGRFIRVRVTNADPFDLFAEEV